MREFAWNYFAATGDIEAYLLYRDMETVSDSLLLSKESSGFSTQRESDLLEEGMDSPAFPMLPLLPSSSSFSVLPPST